MLSGVVLHVRGVSFRLHCFLLRAGSESRRGPAARRSSRQIDPTLRVEELAPAALLTLVRTHAGAEFLERFAESPPEAR